MTVGWCCRTVVWAEGTVATAVTGWPNWVWIEKVKKDDVCAIYWLDSIWFDFKDDCYVKDNMKNSFKILFQDILPGSKAANPWFQIMIFFSWCKVFIFYAKKK